MGMLHFDLMSEKLGYQNSLYVILPDCVRDGEAPEGILYLLHGGTGNGLDWIRYSSIERYSWPYKLAVVMTETDGSNFYADMVHGYSYFSYLTEEVPNSLEALLPILKGVEKRYVAGFSMGGYGAFKWAFNKPDYFTAAANLSGVSFVMDILSNPKHQSPDKLAMIENNWGSLDALQGSDSDSKAWIDNAVANKTKLPKLFAAIGTEDPSYALCQDYLAYCDKMGVPIHYEEMPGGHVWEVWDEMIKRFLAFAIDLK